MKRKKSDHYSGALTLKTVDCYVDVDASSVSLSWYVFLDLGLCNTIVLDKTLGADPPEPKESRGVTQCQWQSSSSPT